MFDVDRAPRLNLRDAKGHGAVEVLQMVADACEREAELCRASGRAIERHRVLSIIGATEGIGRATLNGCLPR